MSTDVSTQTDGQMSETVRSSIRLSLYESAFSTILTTLAGGAFLIGFALAMGASSFHIGLIAALPPFANLAQVFGSYLIAKTGHKKGICLYGVVLHRIVWILIVLMPLLLFRESLSSFRVWLMITAICVASVFQALGGLAWLSWIADLIPEGIRGRFLSNRNAVGLTTAMIFSLFAGQFIDRWKAVRTGAEWESYGFSILFGIGLLFGLTALFFLFRIPPSKGTQAKQDVRFFSTLKLPLADTNFRRFIIFSSYWGFSVALASPFFNVYLIKHLNVPFSLIATLEIVSGVVSIISVRIWGKLTGKFGDKPLLFICTIGAAFFPCFWLFATQSNFSIIWVAYIVSGIAWSGIGVNAAGLLMRLAPSAHNSVYFAVFSAITGIASAIAPIIGGSVGKVFEPMSLNIGIQVRGLQLLFGIGFILRLSSLPLLQRVESPKDATVRDVILHLKEIGEPILMLRANRFNPIENMALFMSRGAAILEGNIERLGDLSGRGVTRGWHLVVGVNQRVANLLLRLEFILNSFGDWVVRRLGL